MSVCIKVYGRGTCDDDGKVSYIYLFSEDESERDGILLGTVIAPDGTRTNAAAGDLNMIWLPDQMVGTHLVSAVSFAKGGRYGLSWQLAD